MRTYGLRKPLPVHLSRYLLLATLLIGGTSSVLARDPAPMLDGQRSQSIMLDDELDQDFEADYEVALDGDSIYATDGFVFIDGQYLPPPYHVQFLDGKMRVNGQPINYPLPQVAPDSNRPSGRTITRTSRRQRIHAVRRIGQELNVGGVLVSLGSHPALWIHDPAAYHEFLNWLSTPGSFEGVPESLLKALPAGQREDWRMWLTSYVPANDVQQRAGMHLAAMTRLESSNWAAVGAVRRLDYLAYPLTILGMLVVVLASGHLLQNRPAGDTPSGSLDTTPQSLRLVTRSLLLVVVFSGLDLIWTLLAFQAGQMRELNPLGSRMIQDPLLLIAFKASMTTMSVGLLLALRKHRPAQVASWWACLICTLLTVRWLVFNSMFVA